MKAASIVALVFLAVPSLATEPQEITATELADILGIKHWRVPVASKGFQWTIDVVSAVVPPKEPKYLGEQVVGSLDAMISVRPLSNDEYEFTLNQGSTTSSGSFVPCKEPGGSKSICSSYSVRFERDPVCLPGCKSFVVATLESDGRAAVKKQIVISQTEQLVIAPNDATVVIPIK